MIGFPVRYTNTRITSALFNMNLISMASVVLYGSFCWLSDPEITKGQSTWNLVADGGR